MYGCSTTGSSNVVGHTDFCTIDLASPSFSPKLPCNFSSLGNTFGQCFRVDFSSVRLLDFVVVIFAFLFVDLFDTLGTLIGVATKAQMLDEDGHLPGIKPALLSDSIGTTIGAVMGTSTITTFVESASGVSSGGRTGLTALTAGLLFLLSTLFAPLFTTIPSFATAPALIMVGFLMVSSVTEIRLYFLWILKCFQKIYQIYLFF